jgi:hypothetical protein
MSYDGLEEKDLPLKLRMMNLLWNLGWSVKPNVKLYQYREGRRTSAQFTDIDVLAIKLLPLQNPIIAVCSAKSGKESDSLQIFWLAGVKSYFGASFAYYVRSKASLLKAKTLCEKLDIIALNEQQLNLIEKRFMLKPDTSPSFFKFNVYKQIYAYFKEVKEKKVSLYNYVTEKFWIDPTSNQLLRIITAIKDVKTLNLCSDCQLFMKYYLTSLLALPLYQAAYSLIKIPSNMVRTEFETVLMGGEMARIEKEKILGACKSFLTELLKRAKPPVDLTKDQVLFDKLFSLDYSEDLSDLLINMVENYYHSIYTPRMLDALSYQLVKTPTTIPNIEYVTLPDLPKNQWKYVSKLTKDILIFVQRIGGFERSEIRI